jgi:hypothetical protein
LSFFYSDDLSAIPVRAVTKLGDNKSDPNIETGTYGLFSTCSQSMRASVVGRGFPYIFFVGRHRGERVIVGFYKVGWYAPGPVQKGRPDYALAARHVHFVNPPLRARDLPAALRKVFSARWRTTKAISAEATATLQALLIARENRTADYVAEVGRLERLHLFHGKFAYVSWQRPDGFSWDDAASYLKPRSVTVSLPAPNNSTASNTWQCAACKATLQNKALLKRCPTCAELGTLQPLQLSV